MDGRLLREPLNGNVLLSELAVSLLDCQEMQRLRRVKQLGMVHLVFPGATHSRFEHSLGVYWTANRIAQVLESHGVEFTDKEASVLQAASLLHDVAHPAFSHAIGSAFPEGRSHHETAVDSKLRGLEVEDVFARHGLKRSEVVDAITGKPSAGLVGQIVRSDIDADRLDYLQRDAYYCGVAYGVIDNRILVEMREHKGALAVTRKGLGPAETVLFARYQMYSTVYNHKTVRAASAMLTRAVETAIRSHALEEFELVELWDDWLLIRLGQLEGYPSSIARRILTRRLYKKAFGLSWRETPKDLRQELLGLQRKRERLQVIERKISDRANVKGEGNVLLDIPPVPVLEEAEVKVVDGDEVRDIKELSPVAAALTESFRTSWSLAVYCPQEVRSQVEAASRQVLLSV